MLKAAFQEGISAASKRFGVREASIMDILLGIGTPMVARAGLNVMAPNLMPSIEKHLQVPFKGIKNVGQGIMRSMRGPGNAGEAVMHGLSGSPGPAPVSTPAAAIGRAPTVMSPVGPR
jgi:hypothetical protein